MLTRRGFLASCLVAPAAPALAASTSLGAAAARSGRYFGAAVTTSVIAADSPLLAPLKRECSVWVPSWQLKWRALAPSLGDALDFSAADALIKAAKEAGKRSRGHTVIWHEELPAGVDALATRTDWDRLVVPYVRSVMGRYRDAIFEWDVVNEAVNPYDGGTDLMRRTPFYRMLGPGYVAEAFKLAAEVAPKARLYLNEDHLYYDDDENEGRRTGLLKLLERLMTAKAPVHALGLQGHLDLSRRFVPRLFERFLDEVNGLGLDVAMTELDVREDEGARRLSLSKRRQRAADEVSRVLEPVFERTKLRGVTTWGLSDADSWLRQMDKGADNQGLPYDDGVRPTAMRGALASLFASARPLND